MNRSTFVDEIEQTLALDVMLTSWHGRDFLGNRDLFAHALSLCHKVYHRLVEQV